MDHLTPRHVPSIVEQIDIDEAKTRLFELVDAASQGAEFILARNDRPLSRLIPFREDPPVGWSGRGFASNPNIGIVPDDFDDPLDDAIFARCHDSIDT